jgi:multimeric flavodoxin WrbA
MDSVNVVILYSGFEKDGATATLAKYIENGIKQSNILSNVVTYNVNYISKHHIPTILQDIKNCNLLIMGTGTYNGNIEDELLDFVNTNFKAGKDTNAINLENTACGQFATAAYYGTGAQPVLNSLSRLMMTFGGNIISGPSWRISQGIIGLVDNPNKSDPSHWEWNKNFSAYLQDNAEAYGKRLVSMGALFKNLLENYTMIDTGLSKKSNDSSSVGTIISVIITGIVLLVIIAFAIYLLKKK